MRNLDLGKHIQQVELGVNTNADDAGKNLANDLPPSRNGAAT